MGDGPRNQQNKRGGRGGGGSDGEQEEQTTEGPQHTAGRHHAAPAEGAARDLGEGDRLEAFVFFV